MAQKKSIRWIDLTRAAAFEAACDRINRRIQSGETLQLSQLPALLPDEVGRREADERSAAIRKMRPVEHADLNPYRQLDELADDKARWSQWIPLMALRDSPHVLAVVTKVQLGAVASGKLTRRWRLEDEVEWHEEPINARPLETFFAFRPLCGVYMIRDGQYGPVVYIGKAKDLRDRLLRQYAEGRDWDRVPVAKVVYDAVHLQNRRMRERSAYDFMFGGREDRARLLENWIRRRDLHFRVALTKDESEALSLERQVIRLYRRTGQLWNNITYRHGVDFEPPAASRVADAWDLLVDEVETWEEVRREA